MPFYVESPVALNVATVRTGILITECLIHKNRSFFNRLSNFGLQESSGIVFSIWTAVFKERKNSEIAKILIYFFKEMQNNNPEAHVFLHVLIFLQRNSSISHVAWASSVCTTILAQVTLARYILPIEREQISHPQVQKQTIPLTFLFRPIDISPWRVFFFFFFSSI